MINIAVIGAGNWGKNLVRNFDALPGARLRYICDLSEQARGRMGRLYPATEVTADFQVALADPAVDAVVVAVEESRHYEIARAALQAGRHTFVEKPVTLRSAEAEQLVELAERGRLKLMVGHLLKYHPAVAYIKRMVAEGQVGRPLYLYFQRVNLGIVRQRENSWWSLGPHDISLACHFFEAQPVSVSATGQAYLQPGVEDVVFANLKFADGRMAHMHVSWLDPHKIRRVTLVGDQKMVVFDDMEASEKIRVYDKGADVHRGVASYEESITLRTGDIFIPKIPAGEPLRMECQHFLDCIEQDRQPISDGQEGVRVVRVLEAGSLSVSRGGEPVEL